ncbi:LysR substrate-binding domain-containing protein [Roseibium salinum]|nr:LysR substrate-binding domain-containing protein [Roseibium salinum]
MSDAVAAVMGKTQQRAVTVTSTTAFSAGWLVPRIGRFTAANPGITLRIHPCETVVDLQRGVADCAIRYGGAPFAGLVAEPLFDDSFAPICSPGLNIRMPEDLKHHTLLHSEWRLQNEFTPSWRKWCKIAGVRDVDTRAGTVLTDESHVIQATIAGQGIALLSTVLVQDELRRGLLVQPFGPALEGLGYHFVFPKTATGNPGIRAVRDWLFQRNEHRRLGYGPIKLNGLSPGSLGRRHGCRSAWLASWAAESDGPWRHHRPAIYGPIGRQSVR